MENSMQNANEKMVPLDVTGDPVEVELKDEKEKDKLFNAISASGNFIVDAQEQVTSNYYFIRIKNAEYNYSSNPTFKLTNGNLRFTSMHDNPKTFVTTVGLYNDNNELLAVAKLSQPLEKTFAKEALVRMKLDH